MTACSAGRAWRAAACLLLGACATAPVPIPAPPDPADLGDPEPIEVGVVPPTGPYAPGFDALHYDLELTLPATGTRLEAIARLALALVAPRQDTLALDLTGLRVREVFTAARTTSAAAAAFRQAGGRLFVPVPAHARVGDTLHVHVVYGGDPDDGLILRDNVHGERGAFGDNWPNRARFWFPSIDHPSDKATVTFAVRAPPGWQVLANGRRLTGAGVPAPVAARPQPGQARGTSVAELVAPPGDGVWRYHMPVPIPTYLMVVGATRFSVAPVAACADGRVTLARPDHCVAVSSWTFPRDSAHGAHVFRRGGEMVEFYARVVAPFPYTKLAHAQSATRFGGMENAGAIFYSERAIAEGRDIEGTVAHETAHQWFGDAVTPHDWSHLWLSEGFASYFGALFFEHADGSERFREILSGTRSTYLNSQVHHLAIVDTLAVPGNNLLQLLNANSYQKGALVLHMLRGLLGDEVFFRSVRRYYAAHEHGTARTADLQRAFETQSGERLGWFFDQWLYRPGFPELRTSWRWDAAAREVVVDIEQTQDAAWPTFRFPLDLAFTTPAGVTRRRGVVSERRATLRFPLDAAPTALAIDPDGWLLHRVVD